MNLPFLKTLTQAGGKMDIELRVGIGKGYVPSEDNDKPNLPLGTVATQEQFENQEQFIPPDKLFGIFEIIRSSNVDTVSFW